MVKCLSLLSLSLSFSLSLSLSLSRSLALLSSVFSFGLRQRRYTLLHSLAWLCATHFFAKKDDLWTRVKKQNEAAIGKVPSYSPHRDTDDGEQPAKQPRQLKPRRLSASQTAFQNQLLQCLALPPGQSPPTSRRQPATNSNLSPPGPDESSEVSTLRAVWVCVYPPSLFLSLSLNLLAKTSLLTACLFLLQDYRPRLVSKSQKNRIALLRASKV